MRYTVKKLAQLSGVSARTLRFYDEIGLLKPAFYGENQYRYYEEEQLLMLQQILFFRELGFPLNEVQRILGSNDFDKIESLKSHKSMLKAGLQRTEELIKTIDKTILHIEGKISMQTLALSNRYRLIAIDRPGMGLSSIHPKQSILSWADDVELFADHLGIKKFSIIGLSGGAPFVAAG